MVLYNKDRSSVEYDGGEKWFIIFSEEKFTICELWRLRGLRISIGIVENNS